MTHASALLRLSDLVDELSGGCSLEEAEDLFGADRMSGLCASGLVTLHRGTGFVDCTECGEPHSEPIRFDGEQRRWYWVCGGEKYFISASGSQIAQLDLSVLLQRLKQILGLSDRSRLPRDPMSQASFQLGAIHDPDRTIFFSTGLQASDSITSMFASVNCGSKHGGWVLTLGLPPTFDLPRRHSWLGIDDVLAIDVSGDLRLVDSPPWLVDLQTVATREDRHRAMWAIFNERGPNRRANKKHRLRTESEAISDQMPDQLKLQPGTIANQIRDAFWSELRISHDKTHD